MFSLGVIAIAKWADHGVLAPGFDMAKPPAVAALGRGRRWVGSLNHTVAAVQEDGGWIDHSVSMIRGDVNHDGASSLAVPAGGGVRVEVSGASNKDVLGIVDGGLDVREEEVVIFGEGFQRNTVDGKLEIGRHQPKGEPRVVANGKRLVELQGESLKEGNIGGSWNCGVSGYEGDSAFVIDESLEGNGKVGVCFAEDRGGEVRPADSDKGFVGVRGLNRAGGIKSSGRAGEGSRALGGGGLNDLRDFNRSRTRRLCLGLGLAIAPGGVISCGLIKLGSATVNDISVGAAGGRSTGVLWSVG